MPNDADRAGTPAGVFGAELRYYRTQAGLSLAVVGRRSARLGAAAAADRGGIGLVLRLAGALDPAGTVTTDKPPGALWLQAFPWACSARTTSGIPGVTRASGAA
jgi:hypothetical protein